MEKPKRLGRGLSSLLSVQSPVQVEVTIPEIKPAGLPNSDTIAGLPQPDLSTRSDGLVQVAVVDVVPNRYQPRRVMDEAGLAALAASIKTTGLMQPIVVRPANGIDGVKWELIAGERRWRAAIEAGLKSIPAVVRDIEDKEAAEWAIVENVQREDLNSIDKAAAFQQLVERFGMTQNDIAERVGVDRSTVANLLRLLELEAPLQLMVAKGELTFGHAKCLLSMPLEEGTSLDQRGRVVLGRRAAAGGWSIRVLEGEIRLWLALARERATMPVRANTPPGSEVELKGSTRAVLEDLGKRLSEKLGTKVKIIPKAGKRGKTAGRIMIEYYDLDHFDGIVEKLGGM